MSDLCGNRCYADFRELRQGEVRRKPLPGRSVNRAREKGRAFDTPALVLVGLTSNLQLRPWGLEAAQVPQGTALGRFVGQRAIHSVAGPWARAAGRRWPCSSNWKRTPQ